MYRRSQDLIFKGGTAIRLVYQGNRYSENLDFNGQLRLESLELLWKETITHLFDFGIEAEMRNAWQSAVGYSFDVSYQGPLYDGRSRTKGKVRIDINLRNEEVEARSVLVNSPYEDLRPFVIKVLNPAHRRLN
ncbi:MAG: nucleotidyl transferase AbiEii/AbiGii toxin family protein [Anaerolineales bacterium]